MQGWHDPSSLAGADSTVMQGCHDASYQTGVDLVVMRGCGSPAPAWRATQGARMHVHASAGLPEDAHAKGRSRTGRSPQGFACMCTHLPVSTRQGSLLRTRSSQ